MGLRVLRVRRVLRVLRGVEGVAGLGYSDGQSDGQISYVNICDV